MIVTKENFQQVREMGLGNGFSVLNPADGYRKDNRLWFGECSVCGERVTNSSLTGNGWEHNLILEQTFHADGVSPLMTRSKRIDYCPMA
jgi:hypothetical protein